MVPKESWKKSGIPPEGFVIAPPDGKWGLVVMLGCIVCGITCVTCNIVFALSLNDMTTALQTNTATISWAVAIASGLGNMVGPLVTIVINNYSCRVSAILGGLLCATGLFLCSFVYKVELLFFTFGILTGVGRKLVFVPLSIVLCHFFKKYLPISMGFLTASYAASRLIMAPVIQLLLLEYGFRGTFLIMGGFALHTCLGASLFQPPKWHSVLVPVDSSLPPKAAKTCEENGNVISDNDNDKNECAGKGGDSTKIRSVSFDSDGPKLLETAAFIEDSKQKQETTVHSCNDDSHNRRFSKMSIHLASSLDIFADLRHEPCEKCSALKDKKGCSWWCTSIFLKSIDFKLLKEKIFYVICLDHGLMSSTHIYISFFIFHLGRELGLHPMEAAGLMSARSFGELSGRLLGPILITVLKLKIKLSYIVSIFVHGFTLIALTFLTSVASSYSVAVASGLFIGAAVGTQGVLVVEIVGVKRLSSVLGLSSFFQGIFLFMIGPFIGFLRDVTGSYASCILFLGGLQFVHAALWTMEHILRKRVNCLSA